MAGRGGCGGYMAGRGGCGGYMAGRGGCGGYMAGRGGCGGYMAGTGGCGGYMAGRGGCGGYMAGRGGCGGYMAGRGGCGGYMAALWEHSSNLSDTIQARNSGLLCKHTKCVYVLDVISGEYKVMRSKKGSTMTPHMVVWLLLKDHGQCEHSTNSSKKNHTLTTP